MTAFDCYGGNDIDTLLTIGGTCNSRCAGDATYICGGTNCTYSIYSTGELTLEVTSIQISCDTETARHAGRLPAAAVAAAAAAAAAAMTMVHVKEALALCMLHACVDQPAHMLHALAQRRPRCLLLPAA